MHAKTDFFKTSRFALTLGYALVAVTAWASESDPLNRDLPGQGGHGSEPAHGVSAGHDLHVATSGHDSHGVAAPDPHGSVAADAHGSDSPGKKSAAKAPPPAAAAHGSEKEASDPEAIKAAIRSSLAKLKEGNERYVTDNAAHPRQNRQRRTDVAKSQKPFAIVITCADSRLPPEVIFDQGLGDLFVIRVAGEVIDEASLGSIEYAVAHLNVPLIMVLGHERCGAVAAACGKFDEENHIRHLVEAIAPAVVVARTQGGDLVEKAVVTNVQRVMDELSASWPVLGPRVHAGTLSVVGGVYDLDSGLVTYLY